jgi:hypothetical protein
MSGAKHAFLTLGLDETSTASQVLRAWRGLAARWHPDKPPDGTEERMKDLNDAKDRCLEAIVARDFTVTEQEFARFVARELEKSIMRKTGVELDLGDGDLIRSRLTEFMWQYAVDAMDWVIRCGIGEAEFDEEIEAWIPVVCKFYNEFIGCDGWSEEDHTMMTVLNNYGTVKAGGYGNFGRRLAET